MPEQPLITDDHYRAFGKIVARFAALEMILEEALSAALKLHAGVAPLVMTTLRYEQKRDLLFALTGESTWPNEIQNEFSKLIKEVDTANRLRRHVAHSIWKRGRKPGYIKPMSVSAKAKVKVVGMKHYEKEYSAHDLESVAAQMAQTGQKLRNFLDLHGLRVPTD